MKNKRLKDALERELADVAISDALRARIIRAAKKEDIDMKRRHKLSALLVAALCVIALAGAALAATNSKLLTKLFTGNEPTTAAVKLLKQSGETVASEGVTLTIGEYIHDGSLLAFDWDVSSDREGELFFATYAEISPADGLALDSMSANLGLSIVTGLGGEYGRAVNSYAKYVRDDSSRAGGDVTATIYVYAYETDRTIIRDEDACYLESARAQKIRHGAPAGPQRGK